MPELLGAITGAISHSALPMPERISFLVPKEPFHYVDSMSTMPAGLTEHQSVIKCICLTRVLVKRNQLEGEVYNHCKSGLY
jgi:hypothetical protein